MDVNHWRGNGQVLMEVIFLCNSSNYLFKSVFLFRKLKTSLKDYVDLESHQVLSSYWKKEILVPIEDIHDEGNREIQVGVLFDPAVFIPHYLRRFIMRQEKEGKPLPPGGHFTIVMKVKKTWVFCVKLY